MQPRTENVLGWVLLAQSKKPPHVCNSLHVHPCMWKGVVWYGIAQQPRVYGLVWQARSKRAPHGTESPSASEQEALSILSHFPSTTPSLVLLCSLPRKTLHPSLSYHTLLLTTKSKQTTNLLQPINAIFIRPLSVPIRFVPQESHSQASSTNFHITP